MKGAPTFLEIESIRYNMGNLALGAAYHQRSNLIIITIRTLRTAASISSTTVCMFCQFCASRCCIAMTDKSWMIGLELKVS